MAGERGQFDGVRSLGIIITDEGEVVELWIAKVAALNDRGYELRRWPEPKLKNSSMVARGPDSLSLMKLRWGFACEDSDDDTTWENECCYPILMAKLTN